jgi:predicted helicase
MYNLRETYYGDKNLLAKNPGRVEKLRWGKKTENGQKVDDYSIIIYNDQVVLRDVPLSAQDYIVNGRSALAWLFDRYQVKTDKNSGIVNDPNDYCDDPRYIIDLIKRVTYVSVQTVERINSMPKINEIKPADSIIPKSWKIL